MLGLLQVKEEVLWLSFPKHKKWVELWKNVAQNKHANRPPDLVGGKRASTLSSRESRIRTNSEELGCGFPAEAVGSVGVTGAVGPREPGALVMGLPLSREGGLFSTFFFLIGTKRA